MGLSKNYNKSLLKYFLLTLLTYGVMWYLDKPLQNDVATSGIISFELAKDLQASTDILNSWNENAKLYAGLSLGFDYIFMYSYSLFLFFSIRKISKKIKNKSIRILGSVIAILVFLAGIFDALENYNLIKLYLGSLDQAYSTKAYFFAVSKFSILFVSIVYLFYAVVKVYVLGKKNVEAS